ncbi:MAG: hypoxanthine phosphoribosyltransferase [Deltaproteobacteria bacterium]|jgi:hypoxanthine phosphoribosyltransferase|nr:hypoxanthine phosphoribosyltransferase [Deltaproteobacteria bacterium]
MDDRQIDVLISEEELGKRIKEIAQEIESDFGGGDLVVVGVLKGSFIFMADLVRSIKRPLSCDFIRISSYENDVSTGMVRMEFDMTQPVKDKNVLLVEDIVDSGRTLRYLLEHMKNKGANKLKVASLLFKEMGTDSKKLVDYIGFEVPERYVIGYGLDSEGVYRSLPYVGAFK